MQILSECLKSIARFVWSIREKYVQLGSINPVFSNGELNDNSVIMAGGSGTLWPFESWLSKAAQALNEKTMLQQTVERLSDLATLNQLHL